MIQPKTLILVSFLALAACASQASFEDVRMADSLAAQGKALLAKGKYAEARDIYLSAASRNDQSPRVWNGLGVAYEMLGKREPAREAYEKALDLAPEDQAAANNLAHLLLTQGKPDEAVKVLAAHKDDAAAPKPLKQNLSKAMKEAQEQAPADRADKEAAAESYAEIGSAPTEGMAKNRIRQVRDVLGRGAEDLRFHIVPEVKVMGGTPVFTVRITGRDPESLCEDLNRLALPCFPHGE